MPCSLLIAQFNKGESIMKRITLRLTRTQWRLLESYQHMLRQSEQPSSKQEILIQLLDGLLQHVEDMLPYEDVLEVAE